MYTHTHTYIYEGSSESFKPHSEDRVMLKIFVLWQHTIVSYKTRKANSNFCFNFRAGEAHSKMRGTRQI